MEPGIGAPRCCKEGADGTRYQGASPAGQSVKTTETERGSSLLRGAARRCVAAGPRGTLAKVGPYFVVLQRGSTVWVARRGELWKCDASQIFAMGPLEVQGLEVIPRDLLMAKERLRFDSEKLSQKLGFVDVTQENQPDENEVHEESDHGRPEPPRRPEHHELPGGNDDIADLPSDVGDYSPDEVREPPHEPPPGSPSLKPTSREPPQEPPPGGPSLKPTSREPPQEPPLGAPSGQPTSLQTPPAPPGQPHALPEPLEAIAHPVPATSSTASPPRPTRAPGVTLPRASGDDRGQWKPNLELKQWVRYDHQATRFRVSMWNDVVRRRTVNWDTGEVIADEKFDGEGPRQLSRTLPSGPANLETILCYRPRPGHPDPGTAVSDTGQKGTPVDEDKRLFDKGLKRVRDGSGHQGNAQPKSKIGGVWVADVVTPWGDKRKCPVIANSRDLSVFGKLQKFDVLWKELQERTLNAMEKKMFAEAKLTEIQNLEGSSAISFVADPEEIRKIKETFSQRIVPSRFILTKKQQDVGQSWKAKARWILLGRRDPDAEELERYAPTPATPTVYLTFQLLSSLRYKLVIMDVSPAFGQSDHHTREQGPLFATMPPSGVPGMEQTCLIRILTAVYGLVNAPGAESAGGTWLP